MTKTNAMRILDLEKITYTVLEYVVEEDSSSYGLQAADKLDLSNDTIFKTLVTKNEKNIINIFCIPVNYMLDLKKAAKVSGSKKIEMVLSKDVLKLTGYMVGACSPIGMKKVFSTYIDETATLFDTIGISGGIRGSEIILSPISLSTFIDAKFCDLICI